MKTIREMQQFQPVTIRYDRIRKDKGRPQSFALNGELGYRLWRSARRIEQQFPYCEEYILSQVSAAPGQWSHFPRFHGDIAGRWLLAETYLYSGQDTPPEHLKSLVMRLIDLQNGDGSFGKISSADEPLNMHKIYGNGWMLKALAQYAITFRDEAAQQAAERLGHFYEQSFPLWSAARHGDVKTDFYAVSVNGYYHALDGNMTLYDLTHDERWLNLAACFLPDLLALDEADHSHMYLTIRRGLLRYYQSKGMKAEIDALAEELHRCYAACILETGGVPERFWLKPGDWSDDEGCSLFDWSILTTHLYELTEDTRWLQYAILNLENHIFYNQTYNGGFGSYELHTGCYKQQGKEAPWCCSLFGPYGLMESSSVWVRLNNDVLEVNHLISGEFTFANSERVSIVRDDEQGKLTINTQDAPSLRCVVLYVPFWLNITGQQSVADDNRFIIEVTQPGIISINYGYRVWVSNKGKAPQWLKTVPVDEPFVLFYGPWLLCHRFHGERAVVADMVLDEAGFVSNTHQQFILGPGFYGESHRITLPCNQHLRPADAARGIDEQSGELYLYPLNAKESPGHGVSALWGR